MWLWFIGLKVVSHTVASCSSIWNDYLAFIYFSMSQMDIGSLLSIKVQIVVIPKFVFVCIYLWERETIFYLLSSLSNSLIMCTIILLPPGSLVRPKVVRSVHYCPTTKKTLERRYTDMTSYDPYPSTAIYPTKDDDGKDADFVWRIWSFSCYGAIITSFSPIVLGFEFVI